MLVVQCLKASNASSCPGCSLQLLHSACSTWVVAAGSVKASQGIFLEASKQIFSPQSGWSALAGFLNTKEPFRRLGQGSAAERALGWILRLPVSWNASPAQLGACRAPSVVAG